MSCSSWILNNPVAPQIWKSWLLVNSHSFSLRTQNRRDCFLLSSVHKDSSVWYLGWKDWLHIILRVSWRHRSSVIISLQLIQICCLLLSKHSLDVRIFLICEFLRSQSKIIKCTNSVPDWELETIDGILRAGQCYKIGQKKYGMGIIVCASTYITSCH